MASILSYFTGRAAAQLPELTDDDFVDLKTDRTVKQQAIIDKVQTLFSGQISESVVYGTTDLASCGQIKVSTGDLKPFTNYNIEKTYTYQTSVATGEGLPTYHVKVAAAVIKKYLNVPNSSNPFSALQSEIAQNNPRALQVAAVLRQVGDGLSPLPEDVQIQASLMDVGGKATFNTQQKGTITFSESPTPSSPIDIRIKDEIDIQESDGTMIGKIPSERTISVGLPVNGDVTCTVVRQYQPEVLLTNK